MSERAHADGTDHSLAGPVDCPGCARLVACDLAPRAMSQFKVLLARLVAAVEAEDADACTTIEGLMNECLVIAVLADTGYAKVLAHHLWQVLMIRRAKSGSPLMSDWIRRIQADWGHK